MKPRCVTHNRTLRKIPGIGFVCKVRGCPTRIKVDWPHPERQPMARQGKARPSRVTKGGRVILSRHHYVGLCYEIWIDTGKQCAKCGRSLPVFSTELFDHIIKRSQGGGDTRENLRPLCGRCHDKEDNQGGKLSRKQQIQKERETQHGNTRNKRAGGGEDPGRHDRPKPIADEPSVVTV